MAKKCESCGTETKKGDYCPACIELKVQEFKSNWRWLTPQNKRCKSEISGEQCPFLAVEGSEYCPPCRSRYDLSVRCEYVLPTGKRCTQYKKNGERYCWTHLRHLEKLEAGDNQARLNELFGVLKGEDVSHISINEIKVLLLGSRISSEEALSMMAAKVVEELKSINFSLSRLSETLRPRKEKENEASGS